MQEWIVVYNLSATKTKVLQKRGDDDDDYLPKRAQSSRAAVGVCNKAHITHDDIPKNVDRLAIIYLCLPEGHHTTHMISVIHETLVS